MDIQFLDSNCAAFGNLISLLCFEMISHHHLLIFFSILLLHSASNRFLNEQYVYIGSFSNYISTWKIEENGDMIFVNNTYSGGNAAWSIAVNNLFDKFTYLFVINQISNYLGDASGSVSLFEVNDNASLELSTSVHSGCASPNFLSFSSHPLRGINMSLYVGHGCSTISMIDVSVVESKIRLSEPQQIIHFEGYTNECSNGDNSSYPHMIFPDYSSRTLAMNPNTEMTYIFVTDRNLDRIYILRVNISTGLVINENEIYNYLYIKHTDGSDSSRFGPRHLAIHAELDYMYVLCETSSQLFTLRYNRTIDIYDTFNSSNVLEVISNISSLGPSTSSVEMTAAEIQISNNGQYLYTSNRDISAPSQGRSCLTVFRINFKDGSLLFLQEIYAQGEHPRHFTIISFPSSERKVIDDVALNPHMNAVDVPEMSIMVVANKDTDSVSTFRIDSNTGLLSFTGFTVSTLPYHDEPIHVLSYRP